MINQIDIIPLERHGEARKDVTRKLPRSSQLRVKRIHINYINSLTERYLSRSVRKPCTISSRTMNRVTNLSELSDEVRKP